MLYHRLDPEGALLRISVLGCMGAALGCSSMTTTDRTILQDDAASTPPQLGDRPPSPNRSRMNPMENLHPRGFDPGADKLLSANRFPDPQRSRVVLPPVLKQITWKGVALTFLLFDDREYDIAVADKDQGPATEWQSAQSAATDHGAVAAINGGFFAPDGKPLGLVIEEGKRIGTWNSQSSLTSGLLSVEKSPRLLRRQHWRSFSPTRHLLQAGPFLIENSAVVRDLGDRERRPRSFLVWNGRHRWAFGVAEEATLAGLSAVLAAQPLSEITITTALNLDGGRSSDLWASPRIPGGPVSTRRIWNTPVRNYLILLPSR